MRKLLHRRLSKAFTLIELMIVVVIVAILALVAIPLYTGNVEAAQFTEGVSAAGSIRTSMRVYAASHNGKYPTALSTKSGAADAFAADLGLKSADLAGKYFTAASYVLTTVTDTGYTLTVTNGAGKKYVIDQDGVESGTYKTGQ